MKENFNEIIKNLEARLRDIENKRKSTNNYYNLKELEKKEKIQEARIEFFKKGYNFANRENKKQSKLIYPK